MLKEPDWPDALSNEVVDFVGQVRAGRWGGGAGWPDAGRDGLAGLGLSMGQARGKQGEAGGAYVGSGGVGGGARQFLET